MKQTKCSPETARVATKAASPPSVNKSIGTKPIRNFAGPKLNHAKVGPKNAPYYQK